MGFTMPHVFILVGAAVTALALLLDIVGFATTGWITGTGYRQGLWEACSNDKCIKFDDLNGVLADWFKAVRAFGILGILALAGSLVCAVLTCFLPGQKIFPMLAGVAAAAASVCILIEFAVYAGEINLVILNLNLDLGYSFALTIVACVLGVVAALLFLMGMGKTGMA